MSKNEIKEVKLTSDESCMLRTARDKSDSNFVRIKSRMKMKLRFFI